MLQWTPAPMCSVLPRPLQEGRQVVPCCARVVPRARTGWASAGRQGVVLSRNLMETFTVCSFPQSGWMLVGEEFFDGVHAGQGRCCQRKSTWVGRALLQHPHCQQSKSITVRHAASQETFFIIQGVSFPFLSTFTWLELRNCAVVEGGPVLIPYSGRDGFSTHSYCYHTCVSPLISLSCFSFVLLGKKKKSNIFLS